MAKPAHPAHTAQPLPRQNNRFTLPCKHTRVRTSHRGSTERRHRHSEGFCARIEPSSWLSSSPWCGFVVALPLTTTTPPTAFVASRYKCSIYAQSQWLKAINFTLCFGTEKRETSTGHIIYVVLHTQAAAPAEAEAAAALAAHMTDRTAAAVRYYIYTHTQTFRNS